MVKSAPLPHYTYFLEEHPMAQEENKSIFSEEINKAFLDTRTILIYGEISQELAQRVCAQLVLLKAAGNGPVNIYINSQGGHVEAGDTIHDMIRFLELPVNMIGTGWVASAGITIYLAAAKERRFSLPNTRFLIHQPSGGVSGRSTDIAIEAEEIIKMRERVNRLIADATGQTLERVTQDTDRNYWMTNTEAIEYGIVSKILDTVSQLPKK